MRSAKPHLRVIEGQPVEVSKRESPLAAARRRAGGTFGWESKQFAFSTAPRVLTAEWMAEQQAKRRKP